MENTGKQGNLESTGNIENEELLREVQDLMTATGVDIDFAAKWTKYSREYLKKFFKMIKPLTDKARDTLLAFRDKLIAMKEILLAA